MFVGVRKLVQAEAMCCSRNINARIVSAVNRAAAWMYAEWFYQELSIIAVHLTREGVCMNSTAVATRG